MRSAERREFVKAVLKATGGHEKQLARRLTLEPKEAPAAADAAAGASAAGASADKLTSMFMLARPYIPDDCFVYAFMYTLLRTILRMNGLSSNGRYPWHGCRYGVDVLRFFLVLYTISSEATIDMLRGGAIELDEQRNDLMLCYQESLGPPSTCSPRASS